MNHAKSVGLLAIGAKGLVAARATQRHAQVKLIATYPPRGTSEPGPDDFRNAFPGARILIDRRPDLTAFAETLDAVFIAGWQYLIEAPTGTPTVVLHDSLLPDLRGFAPTVTALVLGRTRLGVSAILPAQEADTGDLLAQHAIEVTHPLRIADALQALERAYEACVRDVLRLAGNGPLIGTPQDESSATYSIWRDEEDYWIDFRLPADRVLRTILALGDPYPGARTVIDGHPVTIHDATIESDVNFAIRQPGKVWKITPAGPSVVCGTGMIRLTDIRNTDGSSFVPSRLRSRIGFSGHGVGERH
jgi:methionyl-tRNA formyltransferase